MNQGVSNQLVLTVPSQRLSTMMEELQFAWGQTDNRVLLDWGLHTGKDFTTSLTRRVGNVARLLTRVTNASIEEGRKAADAFSRDGLGDHLQNRGKQAYKVSESFIVDTSSSLRRKIETLKENPREVGPQLLMMVVMSLVVSGGPDGNGGAPDLDLIYGIGAHRSVFSHSILMGASLETGLLALLRLTQVVHGKLPETRDPLWDKIAQQSHGILHAATQGASIGMAYHLFVDGLLQPAAYHDLPVSMPIEAHQTIFEVNAAAEALDVGRKPSAAGSGRRTASGARDAPASPLLGSRIPVQQGSVEIGDHLRAIRTPLFVNKDVAEQLNEAELVLLQKSGTWLSALASGALAPITPAQTKFIRVVRGYEEPQTEYENIWCLYAGLTHHTGHI